MLGVGLLGLRYGLETLKFTHGKRAEVSRRASLFVPIDMRSSGYGEGLGNAPVAARLIAASSFALAQRRFVPWTAMIAYSKKSVVGKQGHASRGIIPYVRPAPSL